MNITFQTVYDRKALRTMARALRKTIRKKHSRRSHILGWIIVALGLLLSFLPGENGFVVTGKAVLTWMIVAIMVAALIWEDRINGYFAEKRALPGTKHTAAAFDEEGYTTVNEAGETRWKYENIQMVAETEEYFVFVLNVNHAQAYQKRSIAGGTVEEFRVFLEKKLGKSVEQI